MTFLRGVPCLFLSRKGQCSAGFNSNQAEASPENLLKDKTD